MHRGVLGVAIVALSLVGLLGGCGSDEETLTKAEFIKQADSICRQAESQKNSALEEAFKKKENQGSGKAVEEKLVMEVALPPIATMAEELGDLGAPDAQAEAIAQGYDEAVEKVEADPSAAIAGANPFENPDGLARKYGLTECSNI